jgi:hypothetical protein
MQRASLRAGGGDLCSLTRFQIGLLLSLVSCAINEIRLRGLGPARTPILLHPAESFVSAPLPKTFPILPYHVPEISVKIGL